MTKVVYANHNRKARYAPPDPSLIKKRSTYGQNRVNAVSDVEEPVGSATQGPIGMRGAETTPTPTGYRVPGHVGKYEVFREIMAPGAVGAKLRHPKKTRTLVVVTGMGSIFVETPGVESKKFARIVPGDEVTLKAGETYQLFTSTKSHLEFWVCQEAKYDAALETVEEAKALDVPQDLLKAKRSEEEPMEMRELPERRARNNKTAQLQWERKLAAAQRAGGERLQEFLANEGANAPTGTSLESVSNLVPEKQHEVPKANVAGGFEGVNADPKAILSELVSGSDYTEAELREAGLI